MGDWNTEYPRPLLRRESFLPLHDHWTLNGAPVALPWPPEAELSGFRGSPGDVLDYRCLFTLPEGFLTEGKRLILHLGAVDETTRVCVNGVEAAYHEGGYLPFEADITALLRSGENELTVLALDGLSPDFPHGKQCRSPHGMWYTPVSGIWQPVWLEAVPERNAVRSLRARGDTRGLTLEVETEGAYTVTIPAAGIRATSDRPELRLDIPSPRLWSPEDPFLYDLTVETASETVYSYFALREIGFCEHRGHTVLALNGKPIFLCAVLDQGYFEDGLFLPEEPEEYERDILRMKELGFNALRKHVKLEPEAFYHACDRLGMLVIQDMVSSGEYSFLRDTFLPTVGLRHRRDTGRRVPERRRRLYEDGVSGTLGRLVSHPCVIGYTLFNEGWGQYESDRLYRQVKALDPSRFVISASGWFEQKESDARSEHVYFRSKVLGPAPEGRVLILSECGGFGRSVPGHDRGGRYGYGKRQDSAEALTAKIVSLYRDMILPSLKNGLTAFVYTQLSDVESEINGLYTYDRQVCKVDKEVIRQMNREVRQAFE